MLKNILTQNNIKKILTRWLVMVLGMAWTFANGQDPALLKKAALMHNAIVFLSWIWVILSMLAGKLMTNWLLYGGAFGLDVYLWTIRNAMKNIANFALWFIFLIVIIKEVFALNIQDSLGDIAKKIGRFLIGWVLIQASWFMLLAMISLSTIISTAIAALPSMVIQSDSERWWKIISQVNSNGALRGSKYTLSEDPNNTTTKNLVLEYTPGTEAVTEESNKQTLDFLMPRYNNLGGPLYFMGLSVIGFQNKIVLETAGKADDGLRTMITWFTINLAITLGYAAILIILILINIARIVKIWIFIALLPLNIALWVLKHEHVSILGEDDMSVGGYVGKFNWSNLIQMILQPTIITAVLWLSMIMLTAFISVLWSGNNIDSDAINAAYDVNISSTANSSQFISESVDINMIGNLLDGTASQAGGLFQSLIIVWLTFALMGLVLYVSAKVTKEEWLQKLAWSAAKLATNIPFLPITQRFGAVTKAVNDMSGGKLQQAYTSFKWWQGMQFDEDAKENMEQLRWLSSSKEENKFKYQIQTAKDFTTLQTATSWRYNGQKIKDFQTIYNSTWRQDNFVKHYRQIPNSPLGTIGNIKDLHTAMQKKWNRDALKKILFPSIDKGTIIKWLDDLGDEKRGNTVVDGSPPIKPEEKKQ